ncbi:DUF4097 family beta strand repeat-containing protein [Paenibacillus methanolicus]|uniref:Putative adhesin n=1 Tax=Paenibacillus methanolicus TaxID=582686 RepID=A0A5S5BU75_9BACL|nr:DUF4097 family beta strand repeat-containing protein [Paenibacillus methanolicus]TYP70721.1 putative adhesin [Paenibacillus methanolicus]
MRNWVIAGLTLFAAGAIGTAVSLGSEGDFSFGTVEVAKEASASAAGIERIKLGASAADIDIVRGTSDEFKATLTGRASKKFLDRIEVKLVPSGGELLVDVKASTGFTIGFNILDVDLRLEVPDRQWSKFAIDGGSGNVELSDLKIDELVASIGSGNVHVKNLTSRKLELEAGSGNIHAESSKANQVEMDVSSGNLRLTDVEAATVDADTGSGNIYVTADQLSGSVKAETGSGNVTIATLAPPESATIQFASGSGDLKNEWEDGRESDEEGVQEQIVFGGGDVRVEVETGSGNLYLERR